MKYTADETILTCTLIGEARGEPIEGIIGVASVIRNRFQLEWFGEPNIAAICLAKSQFSCWLETDPNRKLLDTIKAQMDASNELADIAYRQCLVVARAIIEWDFKDNTRGATNYLSYSLYHGLSCPLWAKRLRPTLTLGNHVFLV